MQNGMGNRYGDQQKVAVGVFTGSLRYTLQCGLCLFCSHATNSKAVLLIMRINQWEHYNKNVNK